MTTDRAAFLAERKLGIGGSDAASLFNIGWGCQRRLWYGKRSTPEDFPREETDAMALGQFLEPWFAQKYKKETGRAVTVEIAPISHPAYSELRVNIDRWVDKDGTQSSVYDGILEIKSCGRAAFYKYKREGLPEDYILQLQWGMMATGSTWGSFAIGCRDDGNLMYWDHEADPKLHAEMLAAGPAFWTTVLNGPIPDALEPDDRRCQSCEFRVTCQGSALVQLEPEGELVPAPELAPLVAEKIERDALYDQAVELCEETDEELKTKLGDRQAVVVNGAKLYSRPQKGKTLYKGKELLEAYRKARSIVIRAVIGKLDASKPPEEFQVELDAEMDKFGVPSSEVFISESKPSRPLRLYPAKGGR